jgi:hypothetical protein
VRVKRVARQLQTLMVLGGELAIRRTREHAVVRTVELVTDDGAAQRRKVQADLMLTPGV